MIQGEIIEIESGALDFEWKPALGGWLHAVCIAFNSAPTSAGHAEFFYKSKDGENYNVILSSSDGQNVTSVVYQPYVPFPLRKGDSIQVKYANPDNRRVNVTILGNDNPSLN